MAALILAAPALAGCESTQDKAGKLAASSKDAFEAKGLEVTKPNPDVEIVDTQVLQDPNGTAVAVTVKNRSNRRLVGVPVAINVQDAKGAALFENNEAGLDTSLTEIAMLRPSEQLVWVNDQIPISEKPAGVTAAAGKEKKVLTTAEPRLTLQQIKVSNDQEGPKATGFVKNKSDVDQRELVIYGVAKKDGVIVAAGKGQVPRVRAGQRVEFNVFFIGDPTGATLDLAVPATVTG